MVDLMIQLTESARDDFNPRMSLWEFFGRVLLVSKMLRLHDRGREASASDRVRQRNGRNQKCCESARDRSIYSVKQLRTSADGIVGLCPSPASELNGAGEPGPGARQCHRNSSAQSQ
jgi:hypothetical protein